MDPHVLQTFARSVIHIRAQAKQQVDPDEALDTHEREEELEGKAHVPEQGSVLCQKVQTTSQLNVNHLNQDEYQNSRHEFVEDPFQDFHLAVQTHCHTISSVV